MTLANYFFLFFLQTPPNKKQRLQEKTNSDVHVKLGKWRIVRECRSLMPDILNNIRKAFKNWLYSDYEPYIRWVCSQWFLLISLIKVATALFSIFFFRLFPKLHLITEIQKTYQISKLAPINIKQKPAHRTENLPRNRTDPKMTTHTMKRIKKLTK